MDKKIDRESKIVELDKAKVSKRKYNIKLSLPVFSFHVCTLIYSSHYMS